MAKIRDDLEGVVYVHTAEGGVVVLKGGDAIPDGVEVGDHVTAPVNRGGRPAKKTSDAGNS